MTAITHVGMAVPDVDRAARWYETVLGLRPLARSGLVEPGKDHAGMVAADVLGRSCGSFRQAQMSGANGVGLELFEFADTRAAPRGIFHVCVVAPDITRTAARVGAKGGRQTSRIWPIFEGEPYLTCYCRDPFGNVLELYSHSHERTYANRAEGA